MNRKVTAFMGPLLFLSLLVMGGCSSSLPNAPSSVSLNKAPAYLIGPGDQLQIFVWRNDDLTIAVPVRPDGKISTPLIDDLMAAGKTPSALAKDIKILLAKYIRSPEVTVIVTGFAGEYAQQIRVVGEAANPQALAYRSGMSALDVMIAVGGLTINASGNSATLARNENGAVKQYRLRLSDLLKDGDISANVPMLPGDTIIIPEAWF